MDDSFHLARHVARYVLLLMRQPDAVDQQKLGLRAMVLMAKEVSVRIGTRDGRLVANGLSVPAVMDGVRELADQLVGHRVESVELQQGLSPAEFLAVARILAEPIDVDASGVHKRLRAIEAKTVIVVLSELEPEVAPAVAAAPVAAEPAVGSHERIAFVLRRANRGGDGHPIVPHFEEVAFAAEQGSRQGNVATLMEAFVQLIRHETEATDPEVRRHFVLTLRRLTKPRMLYPIVRVFVDDPAHTDDAVTILTRCGTDGADAIVDQYSKAPTRAERDTFLAALDRMPTADSALMGMLGDARPHVMRVAAELLGRRTPVDGDKALADRITADDPRARRAAIRALGAYDTPFAVDAIARGLDDAVVEVRLEAVAALAARKGGARVGDIIGRAIDSEEEIEVQVGMLSALGRIGTPDAVARLARTAESGAGLFASKRGAALRVAAVRALAETRTAGAMSTLKALANDKEREVRDAAARAIGR